MCISQIKMNNLALLLLLKVHFSTFHNKFLSLSSYALHCLCATLAPTGYTFFYQCKFPYASSTRSPLLASPSSLESAIFKKNEINAPPVPGVMCPDQFWFAQTNFRSGRTTFGRQNWSGRTDFFPGPNFS